MEFVQNPHKLFDVIVYNDEAFSYTASDDMSQYKDQYIKVLIENRTSQTTFDLFLDNLYKVGPVDVSIVEDATVLDGTVDLDIGEVHDTSSIISGYIDSLTLNVDNDKLKSYMNDVYKEAVSMESVK